MNHTGRAFGLLSEKFQTTYLKALILLLQFTLRLPFPSSSPVRWPLPPRISTQGERGRCWIRFLSHRGLRWSCVSAVRDPPLCVNSVPGLRPSHDVFFLTPPSALQDFLLVSVLCDFSSPRFAPVAFKWSLRCMSQLSGGTRGPIWLFLWSHESFWSPTGKTAAWTPQRNYHYSLSVNPPRGHGKGSSF